MHVKIQTKVALKKNSIIKFDRWLLAISERKNNEQTSANDIEILVDILLDNNGDHQSTISNAIYLDL